MKAFTAKKYGDPEVLQLEEVAKPVLKPGEVLVNVFANSVNPADWHIMRGTPKMVRLVSGLSKPKQALQGADFAGEVVELGAGVGNFKVGDRVFAETPNRGAFAEYVAVSADLCVSVPNKVNFQEAACMPLAGITALQALIHQGKLRKGESVLINGSSGGVGHFAVQIAKAYGAKVSAVCSGKNQAFVESLGADEVIAYDTVNIHEHQSKYDLVVDIHGNLKWSDYTRMGRRGVMVGFTTMRFMVSVLLKSVFSKFPLAQFTAKSNAKDLKTLAELMDNGKIKPHIEQVYAYPKLPEAIAFLETMRVRGKLVVDWNPSHV